MATARVLTLCDALVSAVTAAWTTIVADSGTVTRRYIAPVDVQELNSLTGRHVYVFPGPYDNSPDTRGHDCWVHVIGILVVERYTTLGGEPADATLRTWLDDRVDFVESTVINTIDYDGRTRLSIGSTRKILTLSIEVETYDVDMLNQQKLFWSEITATFQDYDVG